MDRVLRPTSMPATPDSTPPESARTGPSWWAWIDLSRPHIHRYRNAALWLIVVITLFRLWFCTRLNLVGDEAYYWLWSKHLDISYFSKGPGVAWTIATGTSLWGDTVFGVRFFAVLLSAGTATGMFLLARSLFSTRVGYWSLVVALGIPLFAVGSLLMTIDPLSVCFWTWAAFFFWKTQDRPHPGWWAATGACVGLGMLCKYTNVVQLLCFAAFLALAAERRRQLLRPGFWTMIGVAALSLVPILLWNARHQWVTFEHLWHRGALDRPFRIDFGEAWDFVTSQFLVASPFLAAGLLAALVWVVLHGLRDRKERPQWTYLLCLWVPLVAFYFVLSFNETGEANWTAPSFVSGCILLTAVWQRWIDRSALWTRVAVAGLALSLAGCTFMHVAATRPVGIAPLDKLFARARAADDLATRVSALQQQHGATFVIANKYPIASLLAFYLPSQPQTYLPRDPTRKNQFAYWPDYTDGFLGETAVFVTDSEELHPSLSRDFATVEPLGDLETTHRGKTVRRYRAFLCREFGHGPGFTLPPAP